MLIRIRSNELHVTMKLWQLDWDVFSYVQFLHVCSCDHTYVVPYKCKKFYKKNKFNFNLKHTCYTYTYLSIYLNTTPRINSLKTQLFSTSSHLLPIHVSENLPQSQFVLLPFYFLKSIFSSKNLKWSR